VIAYLYDNDLTMRRMLEEILAREEEHADDLAGLREWMCSCGIDNLKSAQPIQVGGDYTRILRAGLAACHGGDGPGMDAAIEGIVDSVLVEYVNATYEAAPEQCPYRTGTV
jgi:hypothetical protein